MASECFDCSPPIPSGRYDIVNKVNGNINLIQQVDPNLAGASYRVVADQEALIGVSYTLRRITSLIAFYLYCSGKLNISKVMIIISRSLPHLLTLGEGRRSIGKGFYMWFPGCNRRYG